MRKLSGILLSLLMLFALLIASAELLLYSSLRWYEREYTKYNVQEHMIKEISMESLLEVTDQMMDYLRGDREDLVIYAERDGEVQEFFTQREKDHMADVRKLFTGALWMARAAAVLSVLILLNMLNMNRLDRKRLDTPANRVLETAAPEQLPEQPVPVRVTVSRCFIGTAAAVFALAGGIAALFASDFNKYFVIFHHIFFDNDLWILYPDRDDMINMLPEGFFSDTALAILIIYLIAVVILFALAVRTSRKYRREQKRTAEQKQTAQA